MAASLWLLYDDLVGSSALQIFLTQIDLIYFPILMGHRKKIRGQSLAMLSLYSRPDGQ